LACDRTSLQKLKRLIPLIAGEIVLHIIVKSSASEYQDSSHSWALVDFNASFTQKRVEAKRVVIRRVKQVLEQSHCRVSRTRAVASIDCQTIVSDKTTKKHSPLAPEPRAQVNSDIEVPGSPSDTWIAYGNSFTTRFNIRRPTTHRPKHLNILQLNTRARTPSHGLSSKHPPRRHQSPHTKTRSMCISEQLPRVDLKRRLLANLYNATEPGENMSDDANILEAAQNDTPLDGDFLRHEANNLYDDEPEGPRPWEAYEEIFTAETGIARRANRPTLHPTPRVHNFVSRWYMWIGATKDPEHEIGVQPLGFESLFETFIRENLPKKLDLNSWVGVRVTDMLSRHAGVVEGAVHQWSPWMGTNEQRSTPPPAGFEFLDKYISFLGTPSEGRLVWRKDQWGVPKPSSEEEAKKQKQIERKLRRAEDNLERLSIRIANWLAYWLVEVYAHEIMHVNDGVERERLTAKEIVNAVIEILGDEWFELPFDHEVKLKSWKHKRDMPITENKFTHIIIRA
jgi:hypothetical protein